MREARHDSSITSVHEGVATRTNPDKLEFTSFLDKCNAIKKGTMEILRTLYRQSVDKVEELQKRRPKMIVLAVVCSV